MHISKTDAIHSLSGSKARFRELFNHGTLNVEIYQPVGADHQNPHDRDEIYVILSGKGDFICGEERFSFAAGDFFFVPAMAIHRFENFSQDFATWVFFYGPKGGETNDND